MPILIYRPFFIVRPLTASTTSTQTLSHTCMFVALGSVGLTQHLKHDPMNNPSHPLLITRLKRVRLRQFVLPFEGVRRGFFPVSRETNRGRSASSGSIRPIRTVDVVER